MLLISETKFSATLEMAELKETATQLPKYFNIWKKVSMAFIEVRVVKLLAKLAKLQHFNTQCIWCCTLILWL